MRVIITVCLISSLYLLHTHIKCMLSLETGTPGGLKQQIITSGGDFLVIHSQSHLSDRKHTTSPETCFNHVKRDQNLAKREIVGDA